jgi:hypothetical protein
LKREIRDGVEFYSFETEAGDVEDGDQCARCGSSVAWEEVDSIDLGLMRWAVCLSSPEWCAAHPMNGRENEPGPHGIGQRPPHVRDERSGNAK